MPTHAKHRPRGKGVEDRRGVSFKYHESEVVPPRPALAHHKPLMMHADSTFGVAAEPARQRQNDMNDARVTGLPRREVDSRVFCSHGPVGRR
jgi:hypothetical protein